MVAALDNKANRNPITDFIDKSIEIQESPAPYVKTVEVKIITTDRNEEKYTVKDHYADYKTIHSKLISNCGRGSESTVTQVSMPFPDTNYLVIKSKDGEQKVYFNNPYMNLRGYYHLNTMKVICSGNEVYAIIYKDLSATVDKYSLLRYSNSGHLLGVYNFNLSQIIWRGKGRRAIIDFEEGKSNYEFTILDIDNKILTGYRVSIKK